MNFTAQHSQLKRSTFYTAEISNLELLRTFSPEEFAQDVRNELAMRIAAHIAASLGPLIDKAIAGAVQEAYGDTTKQ